MGENIHLLVLDDEENILNSLRRLLITEPYGVFITADPAEALAVIGRHKIKVVMSDQRMPKTSGIEFLAEVKRKDPNILRILFTGHADIQVAEDAINKGEVYRFISKPWNDGDLKMILREAMQRFDLVQENRELFALTQKQNQELQNANAALKNMIEKEKAFTSTVSHELRTPLASIKMAVDILSQCLQGKIDISQAARLIDVAKKNVDRLARLITDVLTLTRMESGVEKIKLQEAQVNELIQELALVEKPVAEGKGLLLKLELEPFLPLVPLNADKITQVLANLIGNAIKFTEKGEVTVTSHFNKEKDQVEVRVQDTGRGIAPEDIPKLFQKFKQLENSASKVEGTGLGLAICKEILANHQGNIWIESVPGKGSTFIFALPHGEKKEVSRG